MKPRKPDYEVNEPILREQFAIYADEYSQSKSTDPRRAERALFAVDAILDCALELGFIALNQAQTKHRVV